MAQRGRGTVVAAVAETDAIPSAYFAIQGSEGYGLCGGAHGIEHTALVAVAAHIEAIALPSLNGGAWHNGEPRGTAINLHVAKEVVAIGVVAPCLVGANLSTCYADIRINIVDKGNAAIVEREGVVGRTGIHPVLVVGTNHTVESGVKVGSREPDAIVGITRNHAVVANRGSIVKIQTIIIVAHRAGSETWRGTFKTQTIRCIVCKGTIG